MTALTPDNLSWEAHNTFTPEAVAIYFAASGVLLTENLCHALSQTLTTIEKGGEDGVLPSTE